MNGPRRLFEMTEDEDIRLLLNAGRGGPSEGAKGRALAAATGILAASSLSAGTAAGAAARTKAAASAKVASLLSVKWVAIASIAGVSAVAGTVAVHDALVAREAQTTASAPAVATPPTKNPPREAPRVATAFASAPPERGRTVQEAQDSTVPPVTAQPAPLAPTSHNLPRVNAPASARSPAVSTAAELALLDRASGALAEGDVALAVSLLGDYDDRFPHGAMAPEAALMRIEALAKRGDRTAAERAARAFRKAHPNTPYDARIDSILVPPP